MRHNHVSGKIDDMRVKSYIICYPFVDHHVPLVSLRFPLACVHADQIAPLVFASVGFKLIADIRVTADRTNFVGKVKHLEVKLLDIGLDVAASEFYDAKANTYNLSQKTGKNDRVMSPDELLAIYDRLSQNYPIVSIEDPFDQDDFPSYVKMTQQIGDRVQVVGDDLLVTNTTRVKTGIDEKLCNALLLKVNQIGSVTESIEASNMSQQAGWGVMVSHRSGETEDNFIGDLVCGLGTGEIKSGAPCRSDRLAKYNQILRIEEELGDSAVFAGKLFRDPSSLL